MRFRVPIPVDEEGFVGRSCPTDACGGYFKVDLTTVRDEEDPTLHCAYCGHTAPLSEFATQEQIDFAISVAAKPILEAALKEMRKCEFEVKPSHPAGLGFSLTVSGEPAAIRRYREKALEREVCCGGCGFRYKIYGVFGYCPGCGEHNSLQILKENLDVVLDLAELSLQLSGHAQQRIVENALENCISDLDGFGRQLCSANARRGVSPEAAREIRFQNIRAARQKVKDAFGFDFACDVAAADWGFLLRCFEKRHILAHNMGVVDKQYIVKSGDPQAVEGRQIKVSLDEIRRLTDLLGKVAEALAAGVVRSDPA